MTDDIASSVEVDILLATYNGAKYIVQQLESIYKQEANVTFRIIVSDDGSEDSTVQIIEEYWEKMGIRKKNIIYLNTGKNMGVIKNFEFLLSKSQAQYIMFSDQDDVWLPNKIETSIRMLKNLEKIYVDLPILVHTDRCVVDKDLNILNPSMLKELKATQDLSFHQGLLSNVVAGCTMAFNRKLADLSLPFPEVVSMHDWWIFLVAKCYGASYCLNEPTLLYRQHGNNVLGGDGKSRSINAILKRTRIFFGHRSMSNLYRTCFSQAHRLNEMSEKNIIKDQKNMETLKNFLRAREYKKWKLRFYMFRFRYLPRGYISKLAVLTSLE